MHWAPGNKATSLEKPEHPVVSTPLWAQCSHPGGKREANDEELSLSVKLVLEATGKNDVNPDLKTGSNASVFRTSRNAA